MEKLLELIKELPLNAERDYIFEGIKRAESGNHLDTVKSIVCYFLLTKDNTGNYFVLLKDSLYMISYNGKFTSVVKNNPLYLSIVITFSKSTPIYRCKYNFGTIGNQIKEIVSIIETIRLIT